MHDRNAAGTQVSECALHAIVDPESKGRTRTRAHSFEMHCFAKLIAEAMVVALLLSVVLMLVVRAWW